MKISPSLPLAVDASDKLHSLERKLSHPFHWVDKLIRKKRVLKIPTIIEWYKLPSPVVRALHTVSKKNVIKEQIAKRVQEKNLEGSFYTFFLSPCAARLQRARGQWTRHLCNSPETETQYLLLLDGRSWATGCSKSVIITVIIGDSIEWSFLFTGHS